MINIVNDCDGVLLCVDSPVGFRVKTDACVARLRNAGDFYAVPALVNENEYCIDRHRLTELGIQVLVYDKVDVEALAGVDWKLGMFWSTIARYSDCMIIDRSVLL